MENFKKEYRDLEMKVMRSLRDAIEKSTSESKHMNAKAIKVDFFNYTELCIVNDRVTFLDDSGYEYSVTQVSLEDLIDILDSLC